MTYPELLTLVGICLTFLAALIGAVISWRSTKAAERGSEREHGLDRYKAAIEYMYASPPNPALAMEGLRMLRSLLHSRWPTSEDRQMAEAALQPSWSTPRRSRRCTSDIVGRCSSCGDHGAGREQPLAS